MAADAVLEGLRRVGRAGARVAFEGFHLHLSGYDCESRAVAIAEVAALVEAASGLGLPARLTDIGGGLPVRYVAPEAYAHYLAEQGPEHYGTGRVPDDFYPYGSPFTAADWIAGLLQAPCRATTVAGYLRSADLPLALEPGRSLVDQAAISLFRVIRTKPIGDGTAIVFVEGSSFSACETWFASAFLVGRHGPCRTRPRATSFRRARPATCLSATSECRSNRAEPSSLDRGTAVSGRREPSTAIGWEIPDPDACCVPD